MLHANGNPEKWLQLITDLAGKITLTGTFIGIVLASVINVALTALVGVWVVRRNTRVQQEEQAKFSKILNDYKVKLDEQLINYKGQIDKDLVAYSEPIKAALNRGNIAYQLTQAEYIRRQFTYAEELFGLIFQYHRFIINGFSWSLSKSEERHELGEEAGRIRRELFERYQPASLFLTDEVIKSVEDYDSAATNFLIGHETMIEDRKYKKDTFLTRDEIVEFQRVSRASDKEFRSARDELVKQFISIRNEMKRLSRSHQIDEKPGTDQTLAIDQGESA